MAAISSLLFDLNERTIARRIGIKHDEARMRYLLNSNTVADFNEFRDHITDYFNYHYTCCVSHGGKLSSSDAYGRAKVLL